MKTAASIIVGAALASKSALAFPFLRDPKSIELKTEDDRQLSQYQRSLVVSFLKVYDQAPDALSLSLQVGFKLSLTFHIYSLHYSNRISN